MNINTSKKLALTTLLIALPFTANAGGFLNFGAKAELKAQQASFQEKRDGIEYRFKNFREKYPELVTELSAKEREKRNELHERREARINKIQHIKSGNWAVASNKNLDNMIAKKDNTNGFKNLVLSNLSF